jgi:hypothetical protein
MLFEGWGVQFVEGAFRQHPFHPDNNVNLWGIGGNRSWVWKSFLRGLNPIFMDPYDGLVLGNRFDAEYESLRKNLGYARRFARRIDLASMQPRPELASSKYCLARAEAGAAEYLVYLPEGGEVSVDLSAASGRLAVEWFDPDQGRTVGTGTVSGGRRERLTAAVKGDAVAWIRKG